PVSRIVPGGYAVVETRLRRGQLPHRHGPHRPARTDIGRKRDRRIRIARRGGYAIPRRGRRGSAAEAGGDDIEKPTGFLDAESGGGRKVRDGGGGDDGPERETAVEERELLPAGQQPAVSGDGDQGE